MAYQSGGAGGKGALSLLQTITTAGSQTTVDFPGIPGTAHSLQLIGLVGSAFAGSGTDELDMTINGIISISYDYSLLFESGATVAGSFTGGNVLAVLGRVLAASAGTSSGAALDVLLPNYADSSTVRQFISRLSTWNTAVFDQHLVGGRVVAAAPVSRITLSLGNGPFQDGLTLRLYGLT